MNFMMYIAEELREIMAKLGVRTIDELVGRTDLLKVRENSVVKNAKTLDFSEILGECGCAVHCDPKDKYDFELEKTLDESVLLPEFNSSINKKKPHETSVKICGVNRTFGTILGSEITKKFGNALDDDTYTVNCTGGGGQSFGAFIPKGMTLRLFGDSNDYFGKGLSGGKLIVSPQNGSAFDAEKNVIIGNVALYGATSGKAYINGVAGERFCVRNSGATAVAEGCGDHGCEYMTGGRVAVLGATGKNFAAGMSGGVAYVLDEHHDFYLRLNKQMVSMSSVSEKHDIEELKTMIENHVAATDSKLGKKILADFDAYLPLFKKIIPNDYQRMISTIGRLEEKGIPHEQAKLDAFYSIRNSYGRLIKHGKNNRFYGV